MTYKAICKYTLLLITGIICFFITVTIEEGKEHRRKPCTMNLGDRQLTEGEVGSGANVASVEISQRGRRLSLSC